MKSVVKANGIAKGLDITQSLLLKDDSSFSGPKLSIQQALGKWYFILSNGMDSAARNSQVFPELLERDLLISLQTDVEYVPSLLMEEFIGNSFVFDKGQYIKLVQALLRNISDEVFENMQNHSAVCTQIETTLGFIQNFFYEYYDFDSRITKFRFREISECIKIKIDYLLIKLNNSKLLQVFHQAITEQCSLSEYGVSYRQLVYLQNLVQEIETASASITENAVRNLLYYNNFNSICFVEYEIDLIKAQIENADSDLVSISFLQQQHNFISQLKTKTNTVFENNKPHLKKQIADWITEEIKHIQQKSKRASDKDVIIDPELKIQTSLSVAKLAVLIRLLVVDKIIINRTVAPMLKTVSRLFTTLQKDDISFGSLETKYHAPDKATLNMMKDIMQKWIGILGKL
ncbi:MAG: hypothetical protein KAY50_00345 [Chitinophagaceae bacterium]|jgi:hypothetical protein|nr:hypothetical protein [Chitinophagaceae bacterium]